MQKNVETLNQSNENAANLKNKIEELEDKLTELKNLSEAE